MDETTRPVLIGVPGASIRIRELAAELAALEWVQTHTLSSTAMLLRGGS